MISASVLDPPSTTRTAIDRVFDVVARASGATRAQLLERAKWQPLARWRHIAMYLARQTGASYPTLGRAFDRDHSTVLDGVRSVATRMKSDVEFAALVERLAAEVAR